MWEHSELQTSAGALQNLIRHPLRGTPRRATRRPPSGPGFLSRGGMLLTLLITLSACQVDPLQEEQKSVPVEDAPVEEAFHFRYARTKHQHQRVFTSATRIGEYTLKIPEEALSVAIVVRSENTNTFLCTDHGRNVCRLAGDPQFYIETPLGRAQIQGGDSKLVYDYQSFALFFPNDGSVRRMPPGTYRFPLAAARNGALISEAVDIDIYYKIPTEERARLEVNLFVVEGVNSEIQSSSQAEANAVLVSALRILREEFAEHPVWDIDLQLRMRYLPHSGAYAILESEVELQTLFRAHPTPSEGTRVNVFLVEQLQYLPAGVVGLSPRIPGPYLIDGTIRSGIVVEYLEDREQAGEEGRTLAWIIAHELGHYLGLYHTTEINGAAQVVGHDSMEDTASCTDTALQSEGTLGCPDAGNVMFPYIQDTSEFKLTEDQGTVLRLNPVVTP